MINRRGYLKLTKSLTDDRAWAVQGVMVERRTKGVVQSAFGQAKDAGADAARVVGERWG